MIFFVILILIVLLVVVASGAIAVRWMAEDFDPTIIIGIAGAFAVLIILSIMFWEYALIVCALLYVTIVAFGMAIGKIRVMTGALLAVAVPGVLFGGTYLALQMADVMFG